MTTISDNDIKINGINAIEIALANQSAAIISVQGKDQFVIMNLSHYHYLRECELETALAETRADLDTGRFIEESAEQHIHRITSTLNADFNFHQNT